MSSSNWHQTKAETLLELVSEGIAVLDEAVNAEIQPAKLELVREYRANFMLALAQAQVHATLATVK